MNVTFKNQHKTVNDAYCVINCGSVKKWRAYLHGGVVHNHAVEGDFRVTTSDLLAALQEEAVS